MSEVGELSCTQFTSALSTYVQVESRTEFWRIQAGHDSASQFPLFLLYQSHLSHTISQYSYITCIPLIAVYAVGFSIIKYSYGFTVIPGLGSE
jgi:hypothetical protein